MDENCSIVVSLASDIRIARGAYKKAVRVAKRNSWTRLLRKNVKTPWNFICKLAFKKV